MDSLRIPEEIAQVPNHKGGIYSFSLRFPSDYELGLRSKSIDLCRVATNIQNKICDLDRLLNKSSLAGTVTSCGQATHIARTYNIALNETRTPIQQYLITSLTGPNKTANELRAIASTLRQAYMFARPLYVGMTQRQTLRTRLDQHINGETQFSERLAESKLSWRDLKYSYVALDASCIEMSGELEKLIQSLFKPSLSMR